jgi:hypothetical protein
MLPAHGTKIAAKAQHALMECYDSIGRNRGVFPYHQHVIVPLVKKD